MSTGTTPKPKKKATAGPELVKLVGKLMDIAMAAPAPSQLEALSRDKLYEMLVLTRFLEAFRRANPNGDIVHEPGKKSESTTKILVAKKPAAADRKRFSHFELYDRYGEHHGEVWTSVEIEPLSWELKHKGLKAGKPPRVARHELDVCVLTPGAPPFPSPTQVMAWASCKDWGKTSKESVREALGLRRETAYLADLQPSRAPWLGIGQVPADPASPGILACSNAGMTKYDKSVDAMGVYIRVVKYP